ncbi:hypothetical protein HT136_10275 [Novosphingobium profundi]|uniref:hypothetical protein n=1 Tax=Novosphingobium profundi TaxID=1774954 RepID=UPI001BDAE395|nr:hypothetical protein [Novosphingobium profundi]MBT0668751.1 hypothetical protein [Novosphingobium profundi]
MADHMRKNRGGKQPITQHPFFPAIVALWCGALAGLCSIALRPALIEQAILATGLDTLVPMAAPPLGATFRILLALGMTGLGILVGGLLARRIVAPRPLARERRRTADALAEEQVAQPESAEPAPVPAPARQAGGRRRALANMELEAASAQEAATALESAPEAAEPADEDLAPIPAAPDAPRAETPMREETSAGILDVRAFDLDTYLEPADPAPLAPVQGFADESAEQHAEDDAELALPAFLSPASSSPASLPNTETDEPAPALPAEAQVFRMPARDEAIAERPVPTGAGQRLFEAYSQAIAERTSASSPASGMPASFASALRGGETAAPAPGFSLLPRDGESEGESPVSPEPVVTFSPTPAPVTPPTPAVAGPGAPAADAPHAGEVIPFSATEAGRTAARVSPSAAERLAASELDELSQLELLERLALAMRRRREESERGLMAQASVPAPEAADALEQPAIDAVTPQPAQDNVFEDVVSEVAAAEIAPDELETAFEAPAPRPFDAPGAGLAVPAGLRPVDPEALDDEIEALPGYIPPRHIRAPQPPFAMPIAASAVPEPVTDETGDGDEDEESVLEQGYSSLLDLSRPHGEAQGFVRIEEPESEGEPEPVVIFPGEEGRNAAPFARRFEEPRGDISQPVAFPRQSGSERLFDAPRTQDAEETEKALRTALATLQRMSGAA